LKFKKKVLALPSPANSSYSPDIQPCLHPEIKRGNGDYIGTYQTNNTQYFLFKFQQTRSTYIEDLTLPTLWYQVIKLDEQGCLIVIPPEEKTISWLKFIPQEVAHQLTLMDIQYDIQQAGSKEAYLKSLQNQWGEVYFDSPPQQYLPEDVWAFQKLDIPLNEPYVIVDQIDYGDGL
jgi:hypothetical protein